MAAQRRDRAAGRGAPRPAHVRRRRDGLAAGGALVTVGGPLEIDASGGLSRLPDLRAALEPLAAELRERSARNAPPPPARARARPGRRRRGRRSAAGARHRRRARSGPGRAAATHGLKPEDLVVIVGTGELGPGGTGRSRFALELDELDSPGVVAELAWLSGLVRFELEHYRGRWIDAGSGDEVPEERLAERYADEVARRVGLREVESDGTIDAGGHTVLAPVTLERELSFEVASEEEARAFAAQEHADVRRVGERWRVTQQPGAQIRVPRVVPHTRRVAGQFPAGLDLARFGVPSDLIASADRIALVNLACTAEAFADAGLEPEELLASVHPAQVANTQGAGMGGMASLRRLLLDHLLAERAPERSHPGVARQRLRRARRADLRRLLRPDGPPRGRLRDGRGLARGRLRQDPQRRRAGRARGRLRRSHARGHARLRRHGRDREQRGPRGHGARAARGLAGQRRAARGLRRGPGRGSAARRPRRRRARAGAAGARRAGLRRQLRRRAAHVDPGRRAGRAGRRASAAARRWRATA